MILRSTILVAALTAIGTASFATCPENPTGWNWTLGEGDERVDGSVVSKMLVGKKVKYSDAGTENYGADGSYSYKYKGDTYRPNGYVFYKDGSRCLSYAAGPRHDLYVMNDGDLYLINGQGQRFKARIR